MFCKYVILPLNEIVTVTLVLEENEYIFLEA